MKKKVDDDENTDKKPVTVISTDWHLKESNIDQVKDLVKQKCELAKQLGVDTVFCLGDIFDSRSGQKEVTLRAFSDILETFSSYGIKLWMIPGNHDKTILSIDDSFLDPYKHHPKFKLVKMSGRVPIGSTFFYLLPYYKAPIWLEKYHELVDYIGSFNIGEKHILLSHIAMNGSTNNDGSKVECGIAPTLFKSWDAVLLGHYHDQQQIASNVFHIPSIQQNNFGENNQKGFTVVYDDASFELVRSKFKEYVKISIDFDRTSKNDVKAIVKENIDPNKFVRLEFVGSADKIKSLDRDEISSLGIDVKVKVKEIEDTIEYATEEVKEYDSVSIVEEFKLFCEEKGKDFDKGNEYLQRKLKNL
jgi:exonuclease SbcD